MDSFLKRYKEISEKKYKRLKVEAKKWKLNDFCVSFSDKYSTNKWLCLSFWVNKSIIII